MPRRVKAGEPIRAADFNDLAAEAEASRLQPGPGYLIRRGPEGTTLNILPGARAGLDPFRIFAGDGKFYVKKGFVGLYTDSALNSWTTPGIDTTGDGVADGGETWPATFTTSASSTYEVQLKIAGTLSVGYGAPVWSTADIVLGLDLAGTSPSFDEVSFDLDVNFVSETATLTASVATDGVQYLGVGQVTTDSNNDIDSISQYLTYSPIITPYMFINYQPGSGTSS